MKRLVFAVLIFSISIWLKRKTGLDMGFPLGFGTGLLIVYKDLSAFYSKLMLKRSKEGYIEGQILATMEFLDFTHHRAKKRYADKFVKIDELRDWGKKQILELDAELKEVK